MFCPIFFSTIPPYIRTIISRVVTVMARCRLSAWQCYISSQKLISGERGNDGGRRNLRPNLPDFVMMELNKVVCVCQTVWGSGMLRSLGVNSMQAKHDAHSRHIRKFIKSRPKHAAAMPLSCMPTIFWLMSSVKPQYIPWVGHLCHTSMCCKLQFDKWCMASTFHPISIVNNSLLSHLKSWN